MYQEFNACVIKTRILCVRFTVSGNYTPFGILDMCGQQVVAATATTVGGFFVLCFVCREYVIAVVSCFAEGSASTANCIGSSWK